MKLKRSKPSAMNPHDVQSLITMTHIAPLRDHDKANETIRVLATEVLFLQRKFRSADEWRFAFIVATIGMTACFIWALALWQKCAAL